MKDLLDFDTAQIEYEFNSKHRIPSQRDPNVTS